MSTREQILQRIDSFLAEQGMSDRQFGLDAVGDHRFLKRLRSGAGITLTIIERAENFIQTYEAKKKQDHAA